MSPDVVCVAGRSRNVQQVRTQCKQNTDMTITDNGLATDAKSALRFWEEHPDLKLNEATCAAFKKAQAAFQQAADEVADKERQCQLKMAERDVLANEVKLVMTRLRSAVRGFYGPDSNEYAQVGGTRQSERKRPIRQKNGEAPAAGNGNGN
jgi:hypothetical protein